MSEFVEAKEPQYPSIRWTEAPASQEEAQKTVFLGEVVQGILIGRKHGIGVNDSSIFHIQLADGQVVGLWGSTVLDPKMAIIPDNSEVRVTFEGFVKSKQAGRKPWKKFKVEFAKPVTTFQESAPQTGAAPAAAPVAPAAAPQDDLGY